MTSPRRLGGPTRRGCTSSRRIRRERFELMAELAKLPSDMVFFTQITMEAAEDPAFLDAMHAARIRGALVGVEAVTPEGLKDVYKGFNLAGEDLVERLRAFREHGVHVLGSFIFGLPSDRTETFEATVSLAERADVTFAQFVLLTPFPGTIDFEKWAAESKNHSTLVDGVPITRHWLIPQHKRPKVYTPHPTMSPEEIRVRHAGSVGPLLQLEAGVGPIERRQVDQGTRRLRADLEALSADVREHGDRDRQRAGRSFHAVGEPPGPRLPSPLPRRADARSSDAGRTTRSERSVRPRSR